MREQPVLGVELANFQQRHHSTLETGLRRVSFDLKSFGTNSLKLSKSRDHLSEALAVLHHSSKVILRRGP